MLALPIELFFMLAVWSLFLSPVLLPLWLVVLGVRAFVRRRRARPRRRSALLQITM